MDKEFEEFIELRCKEAIREHKLEIGNEKEFFKSNIKALIICYKKGFNEALKLTEEK